MRHAVLAVLIPAVLFFPACSRLVMDGEESESTELETFSTKGVVGVALQQAVLERAAGIAPHNRPYIFNGVQDCYGYVRQVWNAILTDGSSHPEDFYPKPYDRTRWLGAPEGLPVADATSSKWAYFSSPSQLVPGDVLATHKGHAWGSSWHGGIYAGKTAAGHRQWDNTTYNGNGAYNRPLYGGFHYYYKPTHELLAKTEQLAPPPAAVFQSIVSRHSGKCLEVESGDNSAKVWQSTCDDTDAQMWKPEPTGGGSYRFVSKVSGRCLDVPAGTSAKGTALQLWDCNGSSPQSFKLLVAAADHITMVAKCSGQCVDVGGWSTDDQAQVIQWPCHGGNNQQWKLSGGASDVTCPPPGASATAPPWLGDLAGQPCDFKCWGNGTLYNRCGAGHWQFCLWEGVFADCQWMP
jgi:hypothetical protein